MQKASCAGLYHVSEYVQLHVDGRLLAAQALKLREHGYPPRCYISHEYMRMNLLTYFLDSELLIVQSA